MAFVLIRIGAGTGIFTRALLAHEKWSSIIHIVKAVEPSSGMRQAFSKFVRDQRVSLAAGTFEQSGVDNGWADIVIVAQVRQNLACRGLHLVDAGFSLVS
jgi:hypothetical protein